MDTNQPAPFEKLHDKLAKLRSLRDDPAATQGERDSAQCRIDALLAKHGLTEAQAADLNKGVCIFTLEKARWGKKLWLQCAGWLFQIATIHTIRSPRGRIAMMLAPLDAADLRACYVYYVGVLRRREADIRDTVKTVRKQLAERLKELEQEKALLCDALIHRYDLFGPPPEQPPPGRNMTRAELEEWLQRRELENSFGEDAWKRGEKLDGSETLLLDL